MCNLTKYYFCDQIEFTSLEIVHHIIDVYILYFKVKFKKSFTIF